RILGFCSGLHIHSGNLRLAGIFQETRETRMATEKRGDIAESNECDSADFTPNPSRAVWIRGRIDADLLKRLHPQIPQLISKSPAPITLFVDSPGGDAHIAQVLLSILRYPRTQDQRSCRLVTVAIGDVSSAATDILVGGDIAIACREKKLLF